MEYVVKHHKEYFKTGVTRQLPVRLNALHRLSKALEAMEGDIIKALMQELGKPAYEAFLTEIAMVYEEIDHVTTNLKKWAKPVAVGRSINTMMAKGKIISEPLGLVLIIVPTNYPVNLALLPLIAAVSAGNSVIIRMPSELPLVSRTLKRLIERAFRPGHVTVVEGVEDENHELLKQRFDKIMFTGSSKTGKQIMAQAAENLTPVLLELGGKNPTIVLRDADVVAAARKIAWGKFLNAGQTCIAPDHVFVHRELKTAFVEALKQALYEFYHGDALAGSSYSRIGTRRHYDRLKKLLTGDLNIAVGGKFNEQKRSIEPTVVLDVSSDHPLMQEEIFGPILPILTYTDINQVIDQIRSGEKPLAAYVFGQDVNFANKVMKRIPSGGGAINETIMQISSVNMPFGGVGHSGMGSYHGKFGFDAFSHQRSILTGQPNISNGMIYPPYEAWKEKLLRGILGRKKK